MDKKTEKRKLKGGNNRRTKRGGQKGGGTTENVGIDKVLGKKIKDIKDLTNGEIYVVGVYKNNWDSRYTPLLKFLESNNINMNKKWKDLIRIPFDYDKKKTIISQKFSTAFDNAGLSETAKNIFNHDTPADFSAGKDIRIFLVLYTNVNNNIYLEYLECSVKKDSRSTSMLQSVFGVGMPKPDPRDRTIGIQEANLRDSLLDHQYDPAGNPDPYTPGTREKTDNSYQPPTISGGSKKRRHKKKHRRKSRKR